jgi:hypothetical protein
MDLNLGEGGDLQSSRSVSFQDLLALRFMEETGEGKKYSDLVLDCIEARLVMVSVIVKIISISTHPLEQPFMPLVDLAFLTTDEILLLLEEEDKKVLMLGIFHIPEQKAMIRCRLPFPDPPRSTYFISSPTTPPGNDFLASQNKTLHPDMQFRIISLVYEHQIYEYSFSIVLHTALFLKRCKELTSASPGTEIFEWLEWSSNTTSCIPRSFVYPIGFRCIFGSYMLSFGIPSSCIQGFTNIEHFLMLLDFNQIPIRRGFQEHSEEDYHIRLVQGGTGWYTSPARLPEHTIHTGLPYRVFMRRWRGSIALLYLDENTIIVRPVSHIAIA